MPKKVNRNLRKDKVGVSYNDVDRVPRSALEGKTVLKPPQTKYDKKQKNEDDLNRRKASRRSVMNLKAVVPVETIEQPPPP